MKVRALPIQGAFLLEPERHEDERGAFFRAFCASELGAYGIDTRVAQTSLSSNRLAGTLRGMHYAPVSSREAKMVRCVAGRVYDVLLDLRPDEATFRTWCATELSRANARAVVVPAGVAHGFLTLEDESDLLYQMTEPYDAAVASGVRYDDRAFGIRWPGDPAVISERDRTYPAWGG